MLDPPAPAGAAGRVSVVSTLNSIPGPRQSQLEFVFLRHYSERMGKHRRTYEWPRPAVTVDIVLFTVAGELQDLRLRVLLIQRDVEPVRGKLALPGGLVREDEDLYAAAERELAEETGLRDVYLEQVAAVGTPGRDPRGHVVTVVYVALVAADRHRLEASGDVRAAQWFDVTADQAPPVAFDHD